MILTSSFHDMESMWQKRIARSLHVEGKITKEDEHPGSGMSAASLQGMLIPLVENKTTTAIFEPI